MWRPTISQLLMLIVCLASAVALAAFSGTRLSDLWRPNLVARVEVQNFALPARFSLDPVEIADELSAELQTRAIRDTALRLLLGNNGQQQVADVVVPRLLNPGVIRRMFEDMESLGTVIGVTEFQGLITGTIRNDGETALNDVALTLPGALKAELSDGTNLDIAAPTDDLNAVGFGTLEAGASHQFLVWLDRPALEVANRPEFVRTGASGGYDGVVELRGGSDWFGAELEVAPWARWLIAGLLALVAVISFVALAMSVLAGRRGSGHEQAADSGSRQRSKANPA